LRIALLAPLYETVPPRRYGGTERVISYLCDELVRRGHEVTLFAAGGSTGSARIVEVCPRPVSRTDLVADPVAYHVAQLGMVCARQHEFDLIHSHCDFRALPFGQLLHSKLLSTNHNRLDAPEYRLLASLYPEAALTALSESQRRQLPTGNFLNVCHNGVPVHEFPFRSTPGEYLAFVGRLSPEKGPLEAIDVAERSGVPLKIAAKINDWERDYFENCLLPRMRSPLVEYVGELDEAAKREFLANARALVFPICWPEPFGMVMIEAMATGTPVLAFPVGATPEIVESGRTGYLCAGADEMVQRLAEIDRLDRRAIRLRASQRFSVRVMTDRYLDTYRRLLGPESVAPRRKIA
jgi:glycosyltransferase involved in cell wall biosynthesis